MFLGSSKMTHAAIEVVFGILRVQSLTFPDAPFMYGLFTYMKGEKWPHEQVEMAQGKSSHPIRRIWD